MKGLGISKIKRGLAGNSLRLGRPPARVSRGRGGGGGGGGGGGTAGPANTGRVSMVKVRSQGLFGVPRSQR